LQSAWQTVEANANEDGDGDVVEIGDGDVVEIGDDPAAKRARVRVNERGGTSGLNGAGRAPATARCRFYEFLSSAEKNFSDKIVSLNYLQKKIICYFLGMPILEIDGVEMP
jgi:hypothetical protein